MDFRSALLKKKKEKKKILYLYLFKYHQSNAMSNRVLNNIDRQPRNSYICFRDNKSVQSDWTISHVEDTDLAILANQINVQSLRTTIAVGLYVIETASVDLCTRASMMNGSTKYLKGMSLLLKSVYMANKKYLPN